MLKNKKVKITAKGELQGAIGTVKFVGPLDDKKGQGDYVGVQLDKPIGKNNGTLSGKEYFKAKDKHGAFIKPAYLVLPNGTPVANLLKNVGTGSKLSKELKEMNEEVEEEENGEVIELKKKLNEAQIKIKQFEETDAIKDLEKAKLKVKQFEQANRNLKMDNEKIKYTVSDKDDDKVKELNQRIQFFKSQKQAIEKEKIDLKKKNTQLAQELEECAQNIDMLEQLTMKNQTLQAKNQKLKQQLQSINAQLKTSKMIGSQISNQQLTQNIKILNQTVAFLQSDLAEQKQLSAQRQTQIQKAQTTQIESKKLQLKLKQRNQQIQQLTMQLQACSDAATYAQKLTLDNLRKDEQIKQLTLKVNQYLGKVQSVDNQLIGNRQFVEQLNIELMNQQELMDKLSQQISQKNSHIAELNRQVQKYKKKLSEFTNQSSELMLSSNIDDKQKQEDIIPKSFMGFDQYQNKYYNSLKVLQSVNQKLLKKQIQFSKIRNDVGVYMLNMNEAIPEEFTSKFYPQVIQTLTSIKIANDKLYYIYETCSLTFKNKSEIYSKDNQQLAQWIILIMKESSMLFSSLQKLQYSLITAENQEQLSEILAHRVLGQQVRKIDNFAVQLLQRFSEDNITSSIDVQPFEESIETLDQINHDLKKTFTTEYQTKMTLCSQAMEIIIKTYEMIISYKTSNQLGDNAEVDNLLQNLIKSVNQYLTQCCLNPYIRYKSSMSSYLQGISIINSIFNQMKLQGSYHQLGNLYSESENIKQLKQTIITTQFLVKELLKDLDDIVYPSELAKIQTQLPGKVWQLKLKSIKTELVKVKETLDQKAELQLLYNQSKKKCLLLQRDIKDKQSSKEVYERRIGELQLKVEQSTALENQNKRNLQKIKSYEDANKIIEEEMLEQSKKRKMLEEELKKIKQKFDILQTDVMIRNKRQKNTNVQGLNAEDVASLTIFKNAIKESNNMKVLETKKKMMQLKLSPIYSRNGQKQNQNKEDEEEDLNSKKRNLNSIRRETMGQLVKLQVYDPFDQKEKSTNNTIINIDKILQKLNNASQYKLNNEKSSNKINEKRGIIEIGKLIIPSALNQSKNASITICESAYSYTSH